MTTLLTAGLLGKRLLRVRWPFVVYAGRAEKEGFNIHAKHRIPRPDGKHWSPGHLGCTLFHQFSRKLKHRATAPGLQIRVSGFAVRPMPKRPNGSSPLEIGRREEVAMAASRKGATGWGQATQETGGPWCLLAGVERVPVPWRVLVLICNYRSISP